MLATVITAKSGKVLREYANSLPKSEKIAIFPENGLSPDEQADFYYLQGGKFEKIVTFSPFIVSEACAGCLTVLDLPDTDAKQLKGSSVNKIMMRIWRASSIGKGALEIIDSVYKGVALATNEKDIESILKSLDDRVGDSVEKVLAVNYALRKFS